MDQQRLTYLHKGYLNNSLNTQEREEWAQAMHNNAEEEALKDLMYQTWHTITPEERIVIDPLLSDLIFRQITHSTEVKKVKLWPSRLRIGAVAALITACLSISFYFFISKNINFPNRVAQQMDDRQPGGNRATLTLADGSVISLTDANQGAIAKQAGLIIKKEADGQLSYEVSTDGAADVAGTNTIRTPLGGKYDVLLQDGTKVTLNSGSSLTYPVSFKGNTRSVTLIGEAYFEVSKNKHKPFFVLTPGVDGILGQEIKVLGTHFNVSAYADENAYVTTLLEGSVKISSDTDKEGKILMPGEQARVQNSIHVSDGNVNAAVAWKNGTFHFVDESIENVMRQLSRWYDIDVSYEGPAPKNGFWVQVSRQKKLSEVLDVLEQTNSVHFKITGRRVIVMK